MATKHEQHGDTQHGPDIGAHEHAHGTHAHNHAHGHGHSHAAHGREANRSRLMLVLYLSAAYLVAEVIGGVLTNSLALLADAGHMFSDVASLGLAVVAMRVAQRPPTSQRTFGYHRAEILAALANGATLVAASAWIVIEAWQRFRQPPTVDGAPMMAIAAGGLLVNLLSLRLLSGGREDGLNMRGAWLHVATDALGSVGAIVAGLLVWRFELNWADPAVSVLIAALVAFSSWRLLRETVDVLMESAPPHVDVAQIRRALSGVAGIASVHDLHVWSIGSGMVALSGHVQLTPEAPVGDAILLAQLCGLLRERFDIRHVTIQIEPLGFDETTRCDSPKVMALHAT